MESRFKVNNRTTKFQNKLSSIATTGLRISRASIPAAGRKAGAENYSQCYNHENCVNFIFHLSGYLLLNGKSPDLFCKYMPLQIPVCHPEMPLVNFVLKSGTNCYLYPLKIK